MGEGCRLEDIYIYIYIYIYIIYIYIYIYIYIWPMRALRPPPPPCLRPPLGVVGCLDLLPLALETRRRRLLCVPPCVCSALCVHRRSYYAFGSLRSTRGPAPAPPLNNQTPPLLQTAFCVYRLVYVPPCVCTAGPTMQVCKFGAVRGAPGRGAVNRGGGVKLSWTIYI